MKIGIRKSKKYITMIDKLEELKRLLIETENMMSFDYDTASEKLRRDAYNLLRIDLDTAIKNLVVIIEYNEDQVGNNWC